MGLKAGGKAVIITAVVGVLAYFTSPYLDSKYFTPKASTPAQVLDAGGIPTAPAQARQVTAPANVAINAVQSDYQARVLTIPWNATLGLQYANGGATTTSGSLMAARGVRLKLERQDMYDQMLIEQLKFAKAVAKGEANPTEGAAFTIIMGDGYPAYVAGAQAEFQKIGQQLQVVAGLGYSRGEDKCMLPAVAKADPQKARGSLIGAVPRDGDQHICVKWAFDNQIPVNSDEKTYDPDAMNFVAVDAFTKADDNYIAGYCETRPVVSNGKPTGEKRKVCQNGTATWTPGDVKVATMKGGLVSVASTKEYMWQMPALLIGNKQWMERNPLYVQNLIAAALEGGEAVRSDDAALTKATSVAAVVFNEQDGAYWKKYYLGVTQVDKTGVAIELGGSITNGLGDNAFLFGLNKNDNLYKRVYTVFGDIDVKLYPTDMPALVNYEAVVNTTYLQALLDAAKGKVEAVKPDFKSQTQVTGVMAKRSYSIEFQSGKATFTSNAIVTLNDLLDQISISGNIVQLNGHTDNVGDPEANSELSKRRAEAVKAWLIANAEGTPGDRIRTRGYGDSQPVADNATAAGKAKNRRVDVLLLTTK